MKNEISILIPCYNDKCLEQVIQLHRQLTEIQRHDKTFAYEIVVAEDGSTDKKNIECNRQIGSITGCRYIIREKNSGRAAIRNFLAQEAKYEHLLFIDCNVVINNNKFIYNYLCNDNDVIVGGIKIGGDNNILQNNIRYKYEKAAEHAHTAIQRSTHTHKEFRTTNFLIKKNIIIKYPFDENFKQYGYEDVLMGKTLHDNGIDITHIDNPVLLTEFEDNQLFIKKTEEALVTLHKFNDRLRGYSTLLKYTDKIKSSGLMPIMPIIYKITGKVIKNNLTGNKPRLFLFNTYKLLYYTSL